jgi:hypothetical protein
MSAQEAISTPSASNDLRSVKQQLDDEWLELIETIKQNDAEKADADTQPVGILGRWFHTNTS